MLIGKPDSYIVKDKLGIYIIDAVTGLRYIIDDEYFTQNYDSQILKRIYEEGKSGNTSTLLRLLAEQKLITYPSEELTPEDYF